MATKSPATPSAARKKVAAVKKKAGSATKPQSKAPKQAQAASLQQDLKRLEARLKRADSVTRKSVAALETIVQTLDARVATNKKTNKAQLTRQINALTKRLDAHTQEVRQTIRAELKAALSQGGLGALDNALSSATARMDAAELAQADAITKVNRHLADMARAVEARLAEEARDRARDIEGVKTRLAEAQSTVEARIETVERDSADALMRVGDQVSQIYDKLQGGRQTDTDTVTAKVNELALQTQAEFEAYQDRLNARLEELEAQQRAQEDGLSKDQTDPEAQRLREQLSAQLLQLQTRIEGLERDAAMQVHSAANAQATPYVTHPTPTPQSEIPQAYATAPNPYAAALAQEQATDTTAANGPRADLSAPIERDSHIPTEYDPAAFANPAATGADILNFAPSGPAQTPSNPVSPVNPIASAVKAETPPPMPIASGSKPSVEFADSEFEPAPLPAIPYADPAYAEAETESGSPKAVRIGGDNTADRSSKSALLTGRTAKLGLLLVGVSALAIFTARSLLGGNPAPNPDLIANDQAAPVIMSEGNPGFAGPELDSRPNLSENPAPGIDSATIDPIGQYAEAAPIFVPAGNLSALEEAAANGNSIAQFQLGLTRIETGDYTGAVDVLRQSADAGQPAAQYRLAKLYEVGEGVPKNEETARRLIEEAARGGNRIAMHDLALYYTEGRGGLTLDMVTARSWFEQAALRGVVDSQYNLALLSERPTGAEAPNLIDALFWYSVAAQQGDQFAIERRDLLRQSAPEAIQADINTRLAEFKPRPIDRAANGIFGAQPWSAPAQTASNGAASVREDVRQAQSLLAELGFAVGSADGIMGSRTRSAITEFQRTNGLPQTGQVNDVLIDRLQLAAGA
jgi:localization factor PodJL